MRRSCDAAGRRHALLGLVLMAAFLVSAGVTRLPAQERPASGAQLASRASLEKEIDVLEGQIARGTVRGQKAEGARRSVAALRDRLAQGDFRVGDRFVITVRMDSVRADTASVRDSLKVTVLNLPDLSLAGTLRSELNDRVNAHVARYVRNAEVRTNVLTRVAIFGAVRQPGFYYASPDRPVSDLVMLAGGPAPEANLEQFEITRGGVTVLTAKASRRAIKDGRTLEQLDVQSGDEVRIPQKRRINWNLVIQLLFIASSLFFAVFNFLRWYYEQQE